MYKNVTIIGTGIYHPANKIKNDFFINHFKKQGKDLTSFLEKMGRNERYLVDNTNENTLTMTIEASKNALQDAKITADQLDAIVFSSDTPEYLCPSNALILNHELNAVNAHTVYDLNSNCVGMIVALDQISRYMKTSKNIKYALVTGGIMASSISRTDDKFTYPASGDGAAAVILKCTEEEFQRGILTSKYCTKSEYYNSIVSPSCGMTKARLDSSSEYERKQQWTPFPLNFFAAEWSKAIKEFQAEYDFSINEIKYFLLSQYSKQFLAETASELNVENDPEKFIYIGDKYGYTGTSSPIFALNEALHNNQKVASGSKAVLCSVGAGVAMCSLLYEF